MKQIVYWTFLLLLLCENGWSQYKAGSLNNGIVPSITPASPEASALGKYGEWPISQYTGIPNISIPIYQIKAGSINLPVQLSYHGGGVKVDEVHSWVGVNWTLNAGGVINRTVVGLEDENIPNGFLYRNQRNNLLKTSYNLSNDADYVLLSRVAKQEIDTEPDIFYFNFAGYSGKFYFDQQGQFQSIPANNLKLLKSPIHNTLVSSNDPRWEIADAEGNIYQFASYGEGDNGLETTNTISNPAVAGSLELEKVTAWYLTKIIPADHSDEIYFDYVTKSEQYTLPATHSFKTLTNPHWLLTKYSNDLQLDKVLSNGSPIGTASSQTKLIVSGKALLKKIRWGNGEIIFDALTDRNDIVMGKMLDVISVIGKDGVKRREIKLLYTILQNRYYLSTFEEYGSNSVNVIRHSFEYIQPGLLPLRGAFAQDHWGYYNGANSNPNLLPVNASLPNLTSTANRQPNESYMQYGSLKRIVYPTGGYTDFVYEAHRYDATTLPGGGPLLDVESASVYAQALYPQPSTIQRTVDFTIPFDQNNLNLTIQFRNYAKPPSAADGWLPKARLQRLVNQVYQDINQWNAFTNFPTSNVQPNANGLVDFDITAVVNLSQGSYRIVTDLETCGPMQLDCDPYPVMPSVRAQLNYSVFSSTNGTQADRVAGGLRIKKISSSDGTNNVLHKAYTYTPGRLLVYPKYTLQYGEDVWPKIQPMECSEPTCNPPLCHTVYAKYLEAISTSQAILGFTQSSPVGYTFVREQQVNSAGGDNGYVDYTFSFVPDVVSTFQFDQNYWSGVDIANAAFPSTSLEYKRGVLVLKETYKKNGTTYLKVHSLNEDYEFNDNNPTNRYNKLRAMRVKKMRSVNYPCGTLNSEGYMIPSSGNGVMTPDFGYAFYDVITSWVQKKTTTEQTFDAAGQNPMVMVTNYTYNNPQHLQVTSTATTDSKGQASKTEIKYPHDFAGVTVYDQMVARNMIAKPVEIKTFTNNVLQQQRKNNFDFWSSNTLILPKSIQTATLNNSLVTEVDFTTYDGNANPLQYTTKDGLTKSYLWGYNKTYVVAEVVGADHASISSLINQTILDNPASDQALRTELDKIRIHFANSKVLVNTFTHTLLVGMTSQTDANGKTTYYSYDDFGRLSFIKDQNGHVIKKYCYNYQGQVEDCGQPDRTPQWQSTGVVRCKACAANTSYSSSIQEREEKDQNPYSLTYNQLRWVDNGTSPSCTAPADWQFTATVIKCKLINGVNTSEQEREQKDLNPCSPTAGQTRWIVVGTNCATCPKPQVWQVTGSLRCVKDASGNNTSIQEREERNVESCSNAYNTTRWVSNGQNCTTCQKVQVWQATGATRCVKDASNNNTGIQEREERNTETCSPNYNTTRWVSVGQNCTTCPKPQLWQATGTTRCVKDASGNNTSQQEREERNTESCSPAYNTTRWVSNGTNCTTCSKPQVWQATGATRCVKDASGNNTSIQEREERNIEACSNGYNTTRWVSNGQNCVTCPKVQVWQTTGNTRCVKDASGNNTSQQEREERNTESCSPAYNTTRWVSNGTNCTSCPTAANWQPTGNYQCDVDLIDMQGNPVYSGYQTREERDMNTCSATSNQTRWVSNGQNCASCPKPPNWQQEGVGVCQKNASNQNTGYQTITERNLESCSVGGGMTRTRLVYNPSACPLPYVCSTSNCSGVDKKCISNSCVTGNYGVSSSTYMKVYNPNTGFYDWMWECKWRYFFPDGTQSEVVNTTYQSQSCYPGGPGGEIE